MEPTTKPMSICQQGPYFLYYLSCFQHIRCQRVTFSNELTTLSLPQNRVRKRERLFSDLVTVNEENINHLKCYLKLMKLKWSTVWNVHLFLRDLLCYIQSLNPLSLEVWRGKNTHFLDKNFFSEWYKKQLLPLEDTMAGVLSRISIVFPVYQGRVLWTMIDSCISHQNHSPLRPYLQPDKHLPRLKDWFYHLPLK